MKLHKRTVRVPTAKVIQIMTPLGKIVSEFYDERLYTAFLIGASRMKDTSIYDEDTCQFVVGNLDQLVPVIAVTELAPTLRRDAE